MCVRQQHAKTCHGVRNFHFHLLELCGEIVFRYNACMDSGGAKKQIRVVFSGRVQGVGFRYAVCRAAESFTVVGYVRNLSDGCVEVVAEGVEQELVAFFHRIKDERIGRYVAKEQASWSSATGQYKQFGISF